MFVHLQRGAYVWNILVYCKKKKNDQEFKELSLLPSTKIAIVTRKTGPTVHFCHTYGTNGQRKRNICSFYCPLYTAEPKQTKE